MSPPWDPTLRPDVAILIALPEEFLSLAVEYTRKWHPLRNPAHPGSDFLFVGPGDYRCVATIMPRMGPTVASQASMRLLAWQPAAIVNVGIAGGFKEDLRIGDVIVPRQVDAYDETGKIKGVRWERRGSDYRPSAELLADVQELEFTAPEAYARWTDAGAAQLAELKVGANQAGIDALLSRNLLRDRPSVSTNHLASGSFVVASKPFAEFIREANADIHAGEMEAAGMLAAVEYHRRNVSTLVVRGISDHVDADKSELDRIGDGALRRLAMANAWRLTTTLMELNLLPRIRDRADQQSAASTTVPPRWRVRAVPWIAGLGLTAITLAYSLWWLQDARNKGPRACTGRTLSLAPDNSLRVEGPPVPGCEGGHNRLSIQLTDSAGERLRSRARITIGNDTIVTSKSGHGYFEFGHVNPFTPLTIKVEIEGRARQVVPQDLEPSGWAQSYTMSLQVADE